MGERCPKFGVRHRHMGAALLARTDAAGLATDSYGRNENEAACDWLGRTSAAYGNLQIFKDRSGKRAETLCNIRDPILCLLESGLECSVRNYSIVRDDLVSLWFSTSSCGIQIPCRITTSASDSIVQSEDPVPSSSYTYLLSKYLISKHLQE